MWSTKCKHCKHEWTNENWKRGKLLNYQSRLLASQQHFILRWKRYLKQTAIHVSITALIVHSSLPSFSFTLPSNRNFMMHVMELHYKTFSWQTISNKTFNAKLDTVHLAKGNIWSLFLFFHFSLYLPIHCMPQFGVAFCKQNAKQFVIICTISIGEQFCLYFVRPQSGNDYFRQNGNRKHFKPAVSELIFILLLYSLEISFCEMRSTVWIPLSWRIGSCGFQVSVSCTQRSMDEARVGSNVSRFWLCLVKSAKAFSCLATVYQYSSLLTWSSHDGSTLYLHVPKENPKHWEGGQEEPNIFFSTNKYHKSDWVIMEFRA